jgi:hypothetical protein
MVAKEEEIVKVGDNGGVRREFVCRRWPKNKKWKSEPLLPHGRTDDAGDTVCEKMSKSYN